MQCKHGSGTSVVYHRREGFPKRNIWFLGMMELPPHGQSSWDAPAAVPVVPAGAPCGPPPCSGGLCTVHTAGRGYSSIQVRPPKGIEVRDVQ